MMRTVNLQICKEPVLVQRGEMARELRGVRLVDPGGHDRRCGGGGRRVLPRSLARAKRHFVKDFFLKWGYFLIIYS